jgi:hypothetical protein
MASLTITREQAMAIDAKHAEWVEAKRNSLAGQVMLPCYAL